jgi:hypothetical protein
VERSIRSLDGRTVDGFEDDRTGDLDFERKDFCFELEVDEMKDPEKKRLWSAVEEALEEVTESGESDRLESGRWINASDWTGWSGMSDLSRIQFERLLIE